MTTAEKDYLSLHIYYNTTDLRAVLLGCVDPLIQELEKEKLLARYFFIRYWEGGSHVRLRLLPTEGVRPEELRAKAEPFINQFLEDRPSLFDVDAEVMAPVMRSLFEYEYGAEEFVRVFGEDGVIAIAPNNSYAYSPYKPEYDRYGGKHGIALSEEHFHVSSTIALESLRDSNSHVRTSTLGLALQLMLHFALVFYKEKEQVVEFFTHYAKRWHALSVPQGFSEGCDRLFEAQAPRILAHFSQVQRIHACLETTETGVLSKWLRHAYWLRDRIADLYAEGKLELSPAPESLDAAIRRLLTSYVHMMNNRLGVLILEEVYMSHMIIRALERGF